jgi:PhoH-like ATPase
MPDGGRFLDTNTLLDYDGRFDKIYIASVTLTELESIKTSSRKDENIKYKARKMTRWLEQNDDKYEVVICNRHHKDRLDQLGLDYSNDNLIAVCAEQLWINGIIDVFITNDLCLKNIVRNIFEMPVQQMHNNTVEYTGWKDILLADEELAYFYENKENQWNLLKNEYLLIKNKNNEIIDQYKWVGNEFQPIKRKNIKPVMFDDIKPRDPFQMCAIDSLINNDFTILTGMAGTAKTLMGLGYALQLLTDGKINKLVIAHNPTTLNYAQYLGFLPGSRNDKLLGTSLGGILASKLGDLLMIETWINQGKLSLVPMSDIRGFEISDKDCVFVTEAQNMNSYLVKTLIQRCKDGCKIILEGDDNQVDDRFCSVDNNGLIRAIEVFKGHDGFGCVKLINAYRSEFGRIAEQM